jgi:spore coat protein U-like protein
MKYLLALPLLLSVACPAYAQSIDTGLRQVEIVGTANPACLVRSPNSASGVNANFQAISGTSGEIRITELVNPQTAVPRATSINLTLPVICNSAHLLTVQSSNGGLARAGSNQRNVSTGGGFSEFLPYSLNAAWAGQNVSQQSTNRAGLRIVTNNGGAGNVDIGFSVPASNTPLVAGAYSDTIIIEFRAAN